MYARTGDLLALVESIFGAPGTSRGWQVFLDSLCDVLNGTAASFISIDSRSQDAQITVTARTDPDALVAYQQHWQKFDPWAHGIALWRPTSGAIFFGEQLVPPNEMRRTAFYNDFGRYHGITQCLAGMIEVTPNTFSCLSIDRGNQGKPFHERDAELLHALMPHLQRALQIHRRLGTAELMADNIADVVNRLAHGVLLLSSSGRIIFSNRIAERILAARDGLMTNSGELRTNSASSTSALRQAISDAASRDRERAATPPVLLPRRAPRRPLVVVVTPLSRRDVLLGTDPVTVAVFVTDPEQSPVPDLEFLRSTLHLTLSEAVLVRCLVQGLTLEETAAQLGLQLGTVRTRLKVVLNKTDTHRQTDLVRLVLASMLPV